VTAIPGLAEVHAARERLAGLAVRTPLVRHEAPELDASVYLKLENLQPAGAYKTRPAASVLGDSLDQARRRGVFTASSGNSGIALAQVARSLGIEATVVVPGDAPAAKLERLRALGARIERVDFDAWWRVILEHRHPGIDALFFDAVGDPRAMAANGTIALEILEDLPEVDTILVPFGGGGLLCGVAAAAKVLKPQVRVLGCELETARPLAAALAAGEPVQVPHAPSFVSGIGVGTVLPAMWPRLRALAGGAAVASVAGTAAAIGRMLAANKVLSEGAGAVPLAACLEAPPAGANIVCVVSGGNLGRGDLLTILAGETPPAP